MHCAVLPGDALRFNMATTWIRAVRRLIINLGLMATRCSIGVVEGTRTN